MTKNLSQEKNTQRRAGVLMPVSSLPSPFGIGTFGKGAYAFLDWLSAAGMKIWQVLPLLPTGYGDSPYQSCCLDAVNPYFIDFDVLREQGLLQETEYNKIDWGNPRRVDYGKQFELKTKILRLAFARLNKEDKNWQAFVQEGKYFDFALFMSLKIKFGYATWKDWPEDYRDAKQQTLDEYARLHEEDILFWVFTQYIALQQWGALRKYAHEKGISIMGDLPIYGAYDGVETWKYRQKLFALDETGDASLRAGVPPDAFSEDGQLWGNPVYDWEKLKKDDYAWWRERIQYQFCLFDIVRIDHFRAFDRYYVIPAHAETAKEGCWVDGPKMQLFEKCKGCSIVAEDLGIIDDGVRALLENTGYPGMKVFEFAFDGNPENEYLPIFYNENCVAYTGTHDNDTLRSFIESMDKTERRAFEQSLEEQCLTLDVAYLTETIEDECETIIRLLMASKANTVIVPMHDVLCLGNEARLNAPSTVSAQNWTFRFIESDFKYGKAARLCTMMQEYDR